MHSNMLWFGRRFHEMSSVTPSLVLPCARWPRRCFLELARSAGDVHGAVSQPAGASEVPEVLEQRIWWHNPVNILRLPSRAWDEVSGQADFRPTLVTAPVLWNGQDTGNIFHVLASFLSRLWIEVRNHFPEALSPPDAAGTADPSHELAFHSAKLIYVFDLHPKRPQMFDAEGKPLVPGMWAMEFARRAFPGMKIVHVGDLDRLAPIMFRAIHFNMVNWSSWVLPSEDLYPPRISRRAVGPHPTLMAMASTVKTSLGVDEAEGDRAVLLVQRQPPAGRRLTNSAEFATALQRRGLAVRILDLSLMCFAAQVETVAYAGAIVGAHGQGDGELQPEYSLFCARLCPSFDGLGQMAWTCFASAWAS